jgi:hypothetical protein
MTTPPRRSPGAQPGNLNAFKHGFYSRQFQHPEEQDLDAMMASGLVDEIAMLRVVTRRVLAMADGVEDLNQAMKLLGAMGMAATRLAAILRTQKILTGDADSAIKATISQALTEVMQELKLR